LFASVLLRSLRRGRPAGNSAVPRGQDSPGADSEFYLVEAALRRLGIPRERGETLEQWLRRLGSASTLRLDELGPILRLHYRHRFHPQGLAPAERERLRTASRHWADQLRHPRRKVP
jgi:hypothetical protein